MKQLLLTITLTGLMATVASAGTVSYNTNTSTLSCNGLAGCVQTNTTQVTVGGLTLTYNAGAGAGVSTPSNINLGNIVTAGTGNNVDVTGLKLTLNVTSTPFGGSAATATLPGGTFSGSLSTNNSSTVITFTPSNTTTGFGTLPGVTIGNFTYQVLNTTLGIQAPTVGTPVGQTSIQGAVSDVTQTPEPATFVMMGLGLSALGLVRTRQIR